MISANAVSSEEGEMSIFPTKILLATDGSSEAKLATRTAVDLGKQTNSELHVIHVLDIASSALPSPEAADPEGAALPGSVRLRCWLLPLVNIERVMRTVPRYAGSEITGAGDA